jgi:glycosyltransferase involved in cell wall biosynthesis
MSSLPLVSCIMPTHNRRRFIPRAIEYFLRQDYPNRELIILDDGDDAVRDLVPEHEAVHYHTLSERLTTGEKRNMAIELSRGELLMHWDDDDWISPTRISFQVHPMIETCADVSGTSSALFYDLRTGRLWIYRYPPHGPRWLCGGTLCYRRSLWEQKRFERVMIGEDTRFVWAQPTGVMLDLPVITHYVAMVHPRNTSAKALNGSRWRLWEEGRFEEIVGDDLPFYEMVRMELSEAVLGVTS